MFYLSEREFQSQMIKIQRENLSRQRKQKLKTERNKYKKSFKMPSTSKLVLLVASLTCMEIIFFCQRVIITTGDTSALYTMLGIAASMVTIILGYYSKSKAENTKDGITYETVIAQMQQQNESIVPDDAGIVDIQG